MDDSMDAPNQFPPFETWMCGRRKRRCNCGHRYVAAERELWQCPKCGADRRCRQHCVGAHGRPCRMHGGKSLVGTASPTHRGRGYSIDLPTRLADRYRLAEENPELLSCRADAAMLTVRVSELVRRLHTGESGSLWRELLESWRDVAAAGDAKNLRAAMEAHGQIISRGIDDENVWKELADAINNRVSVVTQENSRLTDLGLMLPVEKAMVLVSVLAAIIEEEVADSNTRRRIGDKLRRLMNAQEPKMQLT
jgi:hypothetical protein